LIPVDEEEEKPNKEGLEDNEKLNKGELGDDVGVGVDVDVDVAVDVDVDGLLAPEATPVAVAAVMALKEDMPTIDELIIPVDDKSKLGTRGVFQSMVHNAILALQKSPTQQCHSTQVSGATTHVVVLHGESS